MRAMSTFPVSSAKLVFAIAAKPTIVYFLVGVSTRNALRSLLSRPDSHILHSAPGLDIRGEAELPQFVLMRCVSEMKGGKGRSSLGSDLTGCYSTLQESAEGRHVKQSLAESEHGRLYLRLLFGMANRRHDPRHPKVSTVVNQVLKHMEGRRKSPHFLLPSEYR